MNYQRRVLPGDLLDGPVSVTVTDEALTLSELLMLATEAWADVEAYVLGDIIKPTELNGFKYICTVAGESGDYPTWILETEYALGDIVKPTVVDDYSYTCVVAGESDAEEPTWPEEVGETVEDGTVVWECRLTEPTWPTVVGETVTDGADVVWECTLQGCLQPGLKVLTLIPEAEGVIYWAQGTATAESPALPDGIELSCTPETIEERTFISAGSVAMCVIQES